MTSSAPRRPSVLGVHSLDRFVFSVPDLEPAQRFFSAFGLDARRDGQRLDLYVAGEAHRWGSIHAGNKPAKRLEYLRFGVYADDLEPLRARIQTAGVACELHPLGDSAGIWLRSPDGWAIQLVVAPKVSPSTKRPAPAVASIPAGQGASPARSRITQVRPRGLSHVLCFTPDVDRMTSFCCEVLGLRLSDRAADAIAFLHGAHGSDHHLVAFAKSTGPGLHHTSWDVPSFDAVGNGSEQMRSAGYDQGWGIGRHVLGSNYFHYVRDPWGSWAEYSYDIDHVPHDLDWPAADHPPEDSFYAWGPAVPPDFITNHEQP